MKKKIYKSTIVFQVLSDEPISPIMQLIDIVHEADFGDFSGRIKKSTMNVPIVGKNALNLVKSQGSDPMFFQMDENGNEIE